MFGLPSKLVLYAAVVTAVVAALVGVRFSIIQGAIRRYEARLAKERLDKLLRAKEIRDEVQELTDDELLAGITRNNGV